MVRDFARKLHFEVSDGEAAGLAESIRYWQPFADTVAGLQRLHSRYKLVVLSNIDDDLFAYTAPKLEVPFDAVVTAQQVHSYKPSLNNFEALLRAMPFRASACCTSPKACTTTWRLRTTLGIHTVWVNRRQGKEAAASKLADVKPDLEVPDIRRLAELALPGEHS